MSLRTLSTDLLAALGGPQASTLDHRAALASTLAPLGARPLPAGITVSPALALDRGGLALDVRINGLCAWSATLSNGKRADRWTGHQGTVKEDLVFSVDLEEGELTVSGEVCVLGPDGWTGHALKDEVLFAWSPTLGAVGGQVRAYAPQVNDPAAGSTRSIVETITRIPVDTVPRVGTPVGSMVKTTFFASVPDFVFNVCFAVGDFRLLGPGTYGDPTSPWFNVFVGYYQLDCPKPAWTRPFGYHLDGGAPAVDFDELLRLGKADWNYFSNWMYGVPLEAVTPFDAPDRDVQKRLLDQVTVGASRWDLVDLDGFSAVTAYQSSAAGAAKLVDNTALTPLWRVTYGEPNPRPGDDESFVGALLHARLYVAFFEDAYHTVIFGGTVNKAFDGAGNTRLLDEQMRACRAVMEAHYPTLGFPLAGPPPAR